MKICFITDSIFNLGGVQRVVSVVANKLSEYHDVTILCTDDRYSINRKVYGLRDKINVEINSELVKNNKRIIEKITSLIIKKINENTYNNIKINKKLILEAYYPKKLRDKMYHYLRNKEYDVIIAVEGHNSVILGSISQELNAKTIGWQHNSYDAYLNNKGKYYWKQEQLFAEYLPFLDYCVVLTDEDNKKYRENLSQNINSITIYNPLSFESTIKSKCDKKNILFVGRIVEYQKGLDMLIEAFKFIKEKRPEWNLTIVGEGIDKEKLLSTIQENNLVANVNVLPHNNNIKDIYINSSIFLSTSRWEGFGLVITEAMECGLPVVSFNNSGPSEIIDQNMKNGILIDKYDISSMVDNVINLIDDKEARNRMSIESIKRAKYFKMENIIKQWEKIINSKQC